MQHAIRRHLTYANVVATLCLFVVLGGGAYAAGGGLLGSGGTLHGCVSRNGTLKLVKAGAACRKHQLAIAWNESGPAGPRGASGAAGPRGETGPPGPASGPAGGVLTSSYPNPSIAAGAVTPAMLAPAESWHEANLLIPADWGDYGAPYQPVSYYKDQLGIVHLRGLAKNVLSGIGLGGGCFYEEGGIYTPGVLFRLPVGYRPVAEEVFVDNNSEGFGRIDVTPAGIVCSLTTTKAGGFLTLDGIGFRAEG